MALEKVGDILKRRTTGPRYITREFQEFGYRLAQTLGDLEHKSLYIKLAKEEDRQLLEEALAFVKEAKPHSPAKLFMWKLKQLREQKKKKGKQSHKKAIERKNIKTSS